MDFTQPPSFPLSQAQSKPIINSPFFMFLADQQKAIKDQTPNIKLIDLAANAINEWDQTMRIQDEYTAKSLGESKKKEPVMISNPQISLTARPQIKIKFDSRGRDFQDQCNRDNQNPSVFEVNKLIDERWRELDQQTKAYYEAKSQEAKAVFAEYVALYEATNGKMERK